MKQEEYSFSLSKIKSLPKVASKGLFLACSQAKDRQSCDQLLPIIDFVSCNKEYYAFDIQLLKSAYEIYNTEKSIELINNLLNEQINIAKNNNLKKSEKSVFDPSDIIINHYNNNNIPAAKKILSNPHATFISYGSDSNGSYALKGELTLAYAIENNLHELFSILINKNETKTPLSNALSKIRNYGNYYQDAITNLLNTDKYYHGQNNTLCFYIINNYFNACHSDYLFNVFTHNPDYIDIAISNYGLEKVAIKLLDQNTDNLTNNLQKLSKINDEFTSQIIKHIPNNKNLYKSLLDSNYYFPALPLLTCFGEKSRNQSLNIFTDTVTISYSKYKDQSASSTYSNHSLYEPFNDIIQACEQCNDYHTLEVFLQNVKLPTLEKAFCDTKPLIIHLAENYNTTTIFSFIDICQKINPEKISEIIRKEGWICEENGMRKKGDFLACAISIGNIDLARTIVSKFPDFSKLRAKETLKYLKKKNAGEKESIALGTFEKLLFEQSLNSLDLDLNSDNTKKVTKKKTL